MNKIPIFQQIFMAEKGVKQMNIDFIKVHFLIKQKERKEYEKRKKNVYKTYGNSHSDIVHDNGNDAICDYRGGT